MANNKIIFRCGWCGHPTDKDGSCIQENPAKYLKNHEGAEEELVNGECCPYGDESLMGWRHIEKYHTNEQF